MKRMLMIFLLLALVCQATQKTVVVYVNGINTTQQDARDTRDILQTRWDAYAESKGISSNIVFDWSHNQHSWWFEDLKEATRQLFGQYHTDLTKYFLDQSLIALANSSEQKQLVVAESNTPSSQFNAQMRALDSTKSSTPASLYNPLNDAVNRMSATDRADLASLVTKLKDYITANNKTVCLGHSQGNFFCNLAYQVIQKDFAGTSYALPNNNVLEVISVATPASYTADGRFQYVTYCRDFINMVPYSLNANYHNPVELVPCMPRFTNFVTDLVTFLSKLDWIKVTVNGGGINQHLIGHYLDPSSGQYQRVMELIANSLPNPLCSGDINCYLKDDFRSADYTSNWVVTSNPSSSQATVKTQSGIMTLDSYLTHAPNGDPGARLTVRSRRVFTGLFTASFSLSHIGRIQSVVRLKKAVDDSTVLSLTINTPQNSVTVYPSSPAVLPTANGFSGWRQISFVKKDTQVFLMVDGNSKSSIPTNVMDGYYLEFDSQGDNTLQVKDLLVIHTAYVVSTLPALALNMAQSKVSVKAGKDVDFAFILKSNNGYSGKVTVEPFGLPVWVSATTVTVDVPANQTVNGKFTVSTSSSLKVGDYNFTVTATGSGFRSDPIMQTLEVTGLSSVVAPPTNLSTVVK